jgi:hypothetical protein
LGELFERAKNGKGLFHQMGYQPDPKNEMALSELTRYFPVPGVLKQGGQKIFCPPAVVIPGRLERPTNRTGICHSIH